MKTKLLIGSILLVMALSSKAQITVYRSDIGNLIGAYVIQANDTTNLTALSPGNSGVNQTWDLTGMGNDYLDSLKFSGPSVGSCYEDFPTASIAMLDSGKYIFLYDNNTEISLMGVCGTLINADTLSVPYTPFLKYMTFPSTYNTTFTGISTARVQILNSTPPPDSMRMVMTLDNTGLVDGWGTVNTPTGTYTTLRQKSTTYQTDSIFAYITGFGWQLVGQPSHDTTIQYSWWSKTNPFIASITTDGQGKVLLADYLLSSNIGVKEIKKNISYYTVLPNPTKGKFTVLVNKGSINTIEIYNIMGENIITSKGNKGHTSEIFDLSEYPKGIYMIKIANGENIHTEKVIIQ